MKTVNRVITLALATAFTVSSTTVVLAQAQDTASKTRQRLATVPAQDKSKHGQKPAPPAVPGERLEPDETAPMPRGFLHPPSLPN